MILSFHPCIVADKNILCAGRAPGDTDLSAIKKSAAVILPLGCGRSLYEMAKRHCPNVFPNYDTRFGFPKKINQIKLFTQLDVLYPKTETFRSLDQFGDRSGVADLLKIFDFPFVFKFDWGGEGDNVSLIHDQTTLAVALDHAYRCEQTGQKGFLIQEFIQTANRSLRVVVIGEKMISYWRVHHDPGHVISGVSKGAITDKESDPEKQEAGKTAVRRLIEKTGINLAGFDLIFNETGKSSGPYFLEINYFFGRKGIGGSERFYDLLKAEVTAWLENIGLRPEFS